MNNDSQQVTRDPAFLEFLNREFDRTVPHATVEELAEFAFGGVEAAIDAFEQHRKESKVRGKDGN